MLLNPPPAPFPGTSLGRLINFPLGCIFAGSDLRRVGAIVILSACLTRVPRTRVFNAHFKPARSTCEQWASGFGIVDLTGLARGRETPVEVWNVVERVTDREKVEAVKFLVSAWAFSSQ